jgi:undecaprenyl diphosphate synthase
MKEPAAPAPQVPAHIAIIMDGNGRWAKKRGLPRFMGHRAGVESVRKMLKACSELNVRFLTLYTFSTENWQRPPKEVSALMKLLAQLLVNEEPNLQREKIRVRAIGRIADLPPEARKNLAWLIERTAGNRGLTLVVCLSYGGRSEIVDACRAIVRARVPADDISEKTFGQYFYDPELPDVDLLIRTAGEQRISNFLLWQAAYAEFYFTDTLWPDFRKKQLLAAIEDYSKRERKFGRVLEPAE